MRGSLKSLVYCIVGLTSLVSALPSRGAEQALGVLAPELRNNFLGWNRWVTPNPWQLRNNYIRSFPPEVRNSWGRPGWNAYNGQYRAWRALPPEVRNNPGGYQRRAEYDYWRALPPEIRNSDAGDLDKAFEEDAENRVLRRLPPEVRNQMQNPRASIEAMRQKAEERYIDSLPPDVRREVRRQTHPRTRKPFWDQEDEDEKAPPENAPPKAAPPEAAPPVPAPPVPAPPQAEAVVEGSEEELAPPLPTP